MVCRKQQTKKDKIKRVEVSRPLHGTGQVETAHAIRRPSVCRPTSTPASQPAVAKCDDSAQPALVERWKRLEWEWGERRWPSGGWPPSGLHPSCGCGLETWFVVIGRWTAGFGTTTRRELARKIKPNPNGKRACWVGWLCAVYGWLVLSRHPHPIPSLDGFPGSAEILHGAIGSRSRVGAYRGAKGCAGSVR